MPWFFLFVHLSLWPKPPSLLSPNASPTFLRNVLTEMIIVSIVNYRMILNQCAESCSQDHPHSSLPFLIPSWIFFSPLQTSTSKCPANGFLEKHLKLLVKGCSFEGFFLLLISCCIRSVGTFLLGIWQEKEENNLEQTTLPLLHKNYALRITYFVLLILYYIFCIT